uniref:(northern house mosquito) hypothetical protein n=1 Tax=Culex pipiens TaxID=7175 RepID=A0A8D8HYV5_CULPI
MKKPCNFLTTPPPCCLKTALESRSPPANQISRSTSAAPATESVPLGPNFASSAGKRTSCSVSASSSKRSTRRASLKRRKFRKRLRSLLWCGLEMRKLWLRMFAPTQFSRPMRKMSRSPPLRCTR